MNEERLILEFLYLIYCKLIERGKYPKWDCNNTSLEKRKKACVWANDWPELSCGLRTFTAFKILLNKKIPDRHSIDVSITQDNCVKAALKLGKEILLTPKPQTGLPDRIESLFQYEKQNEKENSRQHFYDEAKRILQAYYSQPNSARSRHDLEVFQRIQVVQQLAAHFDTHSNCNLDDIINKTSYILESEKGSTADRKNLLTAVGSLVCLRDEHLNGQRLEIFMRIKCIRQQIAICDNVTCKVKLADIITKTFEILAREKGSTADREYLLKAVASLQSPFHEELDDWGHIMFARIKVVQQLAARFDTHSNCHLHDIITKTFEILASKKGSTANRKYLLKAVASLLPLPVEMPTDCINVIDWLEKLALPIHMEHFHVLGKPPIFRDPHISDHNKKILQRLLPDNEILQRLLPDNINSPELGRLELISKAELTTLLWHLTYYLQHTPKQPFEYIKKGSAKAPHLPRSIEISSEGSTITVNMLFKSKKVQQNYDGSWQIHKSRRTGKYKEFSHRLKVVYDINSKQIVGISLIGEVRPKYRPPGSSESGLKRYADTTAGIFKDAVSITNTINDLGLDGWIVTLGKKIRSIKRPGAVYYEAPIVGIEMFDLYCLGNIKQETFFDIMRQALLIVKRIHENELCCIDIKLENMIWKEKLFLIDAESARAPNSGPMKTATLEHLAPEFYTRWNSSISSKIKDHIDHVKNLYSTSLNCPPFIRQLMEIDTKTKIAEQLNQKLQELLPKEHRSTTIRASKAADVYALGISFQYLADASRLDGNAKDIVNKLVENMCAINPDVRHTIQQAKILFDTEIAARQDDLGDYDLEPSSVTITL